MRKTVAFVLGGVLVPALLCAQAMKDADKKVAGGGELAPGWQMRIDPKAGTREAPKFVSMGSGFHATSGSRAIYWRPGDTAKGTYTVEATFTLSAAPPHPEAYGLFVGGKNLKDSTENYLYFTLGGNGSFLIKHRAGDPDAMIHTIADWTPNPAIAAPDANGKRTDKLAIVVGPQKVQFMANGKEVYSADRAGMMKDLDGIAGVRVSHNLDVHIADFKITPSK